MAITLNDNLSVQAPKPVDSRYGPYATTTAANTAILTANRYVGLTVGIGTTTITEYWYSGGTANTNLVAKPTGGGGSSLSITDDTATNATVYPVFSTVTSGTVTTEYTSSTKLQYNPNTGVFTAPYFSGNGFYLTNVNAATNISGGSANQINYQTGSGTTGFVAAPTSPTYLYWNGSSYTWTAATSAPVNWSTPGTLGSTTPNSVYCSDGNSQGIAYFSGKQLFGASTFLYNSNGVACVYSSTTNPYMGGSIYSSTAGYSFNYFYSSFVGSWNGNDSVLAFNCYNDTNQLPAYSYAGQASYVITDGSSFTFNFSNGSGAANAEFTPVSGLSISPTGITSTKVSAGSGGVTSTFSIKSTSSSAGVGYATGAGSTITQLTSKSTAVTLNTICGQITTTSSALAASTSVSFTLTNSSIAATDVVIVNAANVGGAAPTINTYQISVDSVLAGSCRIHIRNVSAASASQALVLNFAVIKSVAA